MRKILRNDVEEDTEEKRGGVEGTYHHTTIKAKASPRGATPLLGLDVDVLFDRVQVLGLSVLNMVYNIYMLLCTKQGLITADPILNSI